MALTSSMGMTIIRVDLDQKIPICDVTSGMKYLASLKSLAWYC